MAVSGSRQAHVGIGTGLPNSRTHVKKSSSSHYPIILTGIPRLATVVTLSKPETSDPLAWRSEGLNFNAFGAALRRRFGGRIQRVSVDAGFTCPNVDGAITRGGCNFCDNRSFSPSRRVRLKRVSEQLHAGIRSVRRRYDKVEGFIAYFQPATNTYAPVEQLEELYTLALSVDPAIVGLAVGTRPDCVPDSVVRLLERMAERTHLSVEFGMQTMHPSGLRWMNRAHDHDHMINAMQRCRGRNFECCAHIILGIPGETRAMMMRTAEEVGRLGCDAVKLHNLYAVRGTPLGEQVLSGEIKMMARDDYITTVVDFLERIPPHVVVERVSGDAPPDFLVEPQWCLEKSRLRADIESELDRRGTRQGSRLEGSVGAVGSAGSSIAASSERVRPADNTPQAIRRQIDRRGRLPVLKMQSE